MIDENLSKNIFDIIASQYMYQNELFIPRSIQYESREYIIKRINTGSLSNKRKIFKITFAPNSEVKTIEKKAFSETNVKSISFPASLEELQDGWCKNTRYLFEITISPLNKNFLLLDQSFIIGKSDKNGEYDTLHFARRDIQIALIPSFVKYIKPYSFELCKNLKTIEFAQDSKLVSISKHAFNLKNIESISLPDNVEKIEEGWLRIAQKLANISISPNNKLLNYLDDDKKVIYNKITNEIVFACRDVETVFIPSFIKHIYSNSFFLCKSLNKVEFAENSELCSIGEEAFCYSEISKIRIPKHVQKIGEFAFSYCNKLGIIEFEEGSELNSIEKNAFLSSGIINIKIPSKVTNIGENAFANSIMLETANLAQNLELTQINTKTFYYSNVRIIFLPKSITRIGDYAFDSCKYLSNVVIPEDSELQSVGISSFSSTQVESFTFTKYLYELKNNWCFNTPNIYDVSILEENKNFKFLDQDEKLIIIGKSDINTDCFDTIVFIRRFATHLKIPSFIKYIGSSSFSSCYYLDDIVFEEDSELISIGDRSFSSLFIKSLIIPSKCNQIGNQTFINCTELQTIEFLGNNISIGSICFDGCEALILMSFPNSSQIEIQENEFYEIPEELSIFVFACTNFLYHGRLNQNYY